MQPRFISIPSFYPIPDSDGHWLSKGELRYYSRLVDREITVPSGSINNLASVPWFFRRVFHVNGSSRVAAILHDHLYGVRGVVDDLSLSRAQCDNIFLEAMTVPKSSLLEAYSLTVRAQLVENNLASIFNSPEPIVHSLYAKLMYTGVRLGGWASW